MSFLSIDASDISDRLLADFLSMESSQIVTMHIQSVDQNEAIKTIKHTITELDRSKKEEQKSMRWQKPGLSKTGASRAMHMQENGTDRSVCFPLKK